MLLNIILLIKNQENNKIKTLNTKANIYKPMKIKTVGYNLSKMPFKKIFGKPYKKFFIILEYKKDQKMKFE